MFLKVIFYLLSIYFCILTLIFLYCSFLFVPPSISLFLHSHCIFTTGLPSAQSGVTAWQNCISADYAEQPARRWCRWHTTATGHGEGAHLKRRWIPGRQGLVNRLWAYAAGEPADPAGAGRVPAVKTATHTRALAQCYATSSSSTTEQANAVHDHGRSEHPGDLPLAWGFTIVPMTMSFGSACCWACDEVRPSQLSSCRFWRESDARIWFLLSITVIKEQEVTAHT